MTTITVSTRQRAVLEHALGNPTHYRNYFAADDNGEDFETVCGLVTFGLMKRGRTDASGLTYYHVTETGKSLAFPRTEGEGS